MTLESRLTEIVLDVAEVVAEFHHDYPHVDIDETAIDLHHRLLAIQRTRTFLSGQTATLHRIHSAAQVTLHNAAIDLQKGEAEAVKTVKFKDFDSAKAQNARLVTETLDLEVTKRYSERDVSMVKSALDFTREHLREFERLSQDLNLRIRILYSSG